MLHRKHALVMACLGVVGVTGATRAAIVINEFQYDEVGATDDREFIELYNSGPTAVTIGDWTIASYDTAINQTITIPTGTVLNAGDYYVFAQTGSVIANVDQYTANIATTMEDGQEILVLRDGPQATGNVVDAVAYETNKPVNTFPEYARTSAQIGRGIWSNFQTADAATAPLASFGRFVDGRDTNNNGHDWGMRPGSPGTANSTGTFAIYTPPNVDAQATETDAPGLAGSFVNAKVINPGVVSANNPNAITASPQGGNAIVVVDNSGGGNAATTFETFQGNGAFNISAYLDTSNLAAGENESTTYGLGSADPLLNTPDPEGDIFVLTGPTASGNTGIGWLYQKFGDRATLYLYDAGDGGNSSPDTSPVDWTYLAEIDLSDAASGWHQLAITVDASGNAVAVFDGQFFQFVTDPDQVGAFAVSYREAIAGSPSAGGIFRPPTFDISLAPIPEPGALGLAGAATVGLLLGRRRRRA